MTERSGIEIEMKKNSLKQLQSGDWVVSFTASQIDFPTELATAAMGQRFMAVLVPLGDFEEAPTNSKPENKHQLSRQAALCCNDKRFWAFLHETYMSAEPPINSVEHAAAIVREICVIDSRAELDRDEEAATRWRNWHGKYEAWLLNA